jgi:short-subunit dehydrogenase
MKKKGGVVVNVASAAALREVPDAEVYAATKSAVYHFTRSLGHLSKQGIRVVAICPSAVPTPLWRSLKNIPTVGKDETVWKRMEERADKLTVDDIVTAMMFAVGWQTARFFYLTVSDKLAQIRSTWRIWLVSVFLFTARARSMSGHRVESSAVVFAVKMPRSELTRPDD